MKWRLFRSEIDPHEGFADQLAAARAPYAEAWKQFDRLQAKAKGGGARWFHFILTIIFPLVGGSAFGLVALRGHKAYVIAAFFGLTLLAAEKVRFDRRRFADWPCPRCHSVWPGTKAEKDSSCKVCGLRLHQMAP